MVSYADEWVILLSRFVGKCVSGDCKIQIRHESNQNGADAIHRQDKESIPLRAAKS